MGWYTIAGVMLMQSSPRASLWKHAAYMGFVMFPIVLGEGTYGER